MKFNANYIHSHEMETLLKNAKSVEIGARRIQSDLSKMLASMNSIITSWHNALQCDGSCWTFIKIVIKASCRNSVFFWNELIVNALLIDSTSNTLSVNSKQFCRISS